MVGPPPRSAERQERLNAQLAATLGLWTLTGVLGGFAVALGRESGLVFVIVTAAAVALAWIAGLYGFQTLMRYWRGLDELARDAHKTAWFWGGSIGLLLTVGVMLALLGLKGGALVGHREAEMIILGMFICIALQTAGYGLFWAGFWLRTRR